jgi:hypothetical protein
MSVRSVLGKIRWSLLAGVAVLAGLILTLPPFRLTLLGWLRGESCYGGRPISYWRHQLRDWRITGEPDLGTDDDEGGGNAKGKGHEFLYVWDHPGKWDLRHRDTAAQQTNAALRRFKDHLAGHGTCLDPTYGEPFCRLAILEGDPAAVPVLTALLKDEDLGIRRHAAAALGTIGPRARAAFPALLETAGQDKDALLRGIVRTVLLDLDKEAAEKAGVVDHFIFWSPQPRLRATIQGSFFLNSPRPFLAEGKILAWDDTDQTVTLRELAAGKVLASFHDPTDCAPPTVFGPGGMTVASLLQGLGRRPVDHLVFSPDGKSVASVGKDRRTVRAWDLATGEILATLRGHTDTVEALAFSPDGRTLASGSRDKTVKLWAVSNGQDTATLRGHTGYVSAVAFSPDGRVLASGGSGGVDRAVKLWDLPTGKELASCLHDPAPFSGVKCLAFSPDGKTLASGSLVSQVMLVDVTSGGKRAMLDEGEDSGSLDSVAFSPDGKTLAYVSYDRICLCDVATGKNTVKIPAEPGNVDGAVFTPDGRILAVTKGKNGHGERLWEFAAIPGGMK